MRFFVTQLQQRHIRYLTSVLLVCLISNVSLSANHSFIAEIRQYPEEFSDEAAWDYINTLTENSNTVTAYYGQGLAEELFGEVYLPEEEVFADELGDDSANDEIVLNSDLEIFPNPTAGYLSVNLPVVPRENFSYSVYGLSGVLVDKGTIAKAKSVLNLTRIPKGIYILHVEGQNYSERTKFVLLP